MFKQDERQHAAFLLAAKELGTTEIGGVVDNPKIVQWFADVGHSWVKDDETAWCAAFLGAMLEKAGMSSTRKLNARSYLQWGEGIDLGSAERGDICVFWRGSPNAATGHVAFYVDHDERVVSVLGGNQSNKVGIDDYAQGRLLGIRRMPAPRPKSLIAVIIDFIMRLFRRK